jgi:hypothetical protein
MADDEKEFANLGVALSQAAQQVIFVELLRMLINKGLLSEGEVIARYERLATAMMGERYGPYVVQGADRVIEAITGKPRTPS